MIDIGRGETYACLPWRNYGAVMVEEQGYRVPEVCRIVGISYRQLDYWARTGLVTPSVREAGGSGTQRLYSFNDLVQLRVIKKLLDAGISMTFSWTRS